MISIFDRCIGMKKIVLLGLSGGVDSAVSACLLQKEGYDVRPIYMKNWHGDDAHCTNDQDLQDAKAIATHLGLQLEVLDFSKDYWDRVFQRCLDDISLGLTPNPDILCNSEIKFKAFLDYAKALGVSHLATGHYARSIEGELWRGLDGHKDQTYFLYRLTSVALAFTLFPCGRLKKETVRAIASEHGLMVADKKDSTGICFIGEKNYRAFMSSYLLDQPGKIVNEDGKILGTHQGVMYYTIGQRQGLHIGGRSDCEDAPWYVAQKNLSDQTLVVTQNPTSPLIWQDYLEASDLHWITAPPKVHKDYYAKIRHQQEPVPCKVTAIDVQSITVKFQDMQRAITPGQHVVLYEGERCLGGGVIQGFQK